MQYILDNVALFFVGIIFLLVVPALLSGRRKWSLLNDREIKKFAEQKNMISPFLPEKIRQGHLSGGLGHFGYDIHISGCIKKIKAHQRPICLTDENEDLSQIRYTTHDLDGYILKPGEFILAFTKEHFIIPDNVVAKVHDKSTLARVAVAVQNTVLEPGWEGFLTIEISNHGPLEIKLTDGMPIAQVIFERGNIPMVLYNGRYQRQKHGTAAINNLTQTNSNS